MAVSHHSCRVQPVAASQAAGHTVVSRHAEKRSFQHGGPA
jgi:hypothetical protein